jgi:hypothetical protein
MSRSNLLRLLGPAYDSIRMRVAHTVSPAGRIPVGFLLVTAIGLGCANQSNATDRQLKEQDARLMRLSASCDRLEERLAAVEAAFRASNGRIQVPERPGASRPDLPTVKVVPEGTKAQMPPLSDRAPDNADEDNRRLLIVGEGARVEARTANETPSAAGARRTPSVNSRASKGNQGSLPAASTGGAPQ